MANNPRAQLQLANTPNAQLQRAPSPPPWFGPHAIREAVERLVVSDNNPKGDAGCTLEEIKVSLMQTHKQRQRQQEIQEELPLNFFDYNMLREQLAGLLQMGDLKLVGVSGEAHYTLSPPYLPLWFRPKAVLHAVGELDGINAGGSTWAHIRDALKPCYQPDHPLPPDFDNVLRAMLSVLRQKGHLTWGASGPRHYTQQQAPALVEPNPIHIPDYLWFYYLGYKLRAGDGLLDDSGPALPAWMANNPNNVPSWFGPGTVLQEIERLCLMDEIKRGYLGCTCEEIRLSLMRTHKQKEQELPYGFDLDATLRATLATLTKRGYLRKDLIVHEGLFYPLSMTPPVFFYFPTWFRPEAVLHAVGKLDDDNNNDHGSTSEDIRSYLERKHGRISYPQWFTELLQTMLSVLRQRGHLRWGASGPQKYTLRGAPVTTGIPDDYLLCYYAGYNGEPAVEMEVRKRNNDGLRRRNTPAIPEEEEAPLLKTSTRSADDERTNNEAKRKEKRNQQRKRYMIFSMLLSFIGHAILFGLTFISGFGEETYGHHDKNWLKWGVMDLIVPLFLLVAMVIIQMSFFPEDISEDKKSVEWNKIVSLSVSSCSKIVYFSVKELPVANVTLRVIAHVAAFLIDLAGALYLCWNHSCGDQELPDQ